MGARLIDITGQTFGRLRVLRYINTTVSGALFECHCECGKTTTATGSALRRGVKQSCGCLSKEIKRRNGLDSPNTGRVGPKNHRWRGGRHTGSEGYVRVSIKHLYPELMDMYPHRYTLPEHHAVMSRQRRACPSARPVERTRAAATLRGLC